VGIDLPKIEVKFEHLTVEADINTGSRALPSFINFHIDIFESSGKVTYNGHELHEFVPERTSAYISQDDVHIGEMTVRDWLSLHDAKGSDPVMMLAKLSRREKDTNIKPDPDVDVFMKSAASKGQEANVVTDYTLKMLGLDVCADTMVGNQMIRGISGGQKKRVTTDNAANKEEPVRRGPEAEAPGSTLRRSSRNCIGV
nr:pleiotropic drug resistance protein 1-like [Tanacetum cinerariifolium]